MFDQTIPPPSDSGIRIDQQLEPEQEELEEFGPEELEQVMDVRNGPMTRAKAQRLQQAIGIMLNLAESNLSTIANPTTLVVIQAS